MLYNIKYFYQIIMVKRAGNTRFLRKKSTPKSFNLQCLCRATDGSSVILSQYINFLCSDTKSILGATASYFPKGFETHLIYP